MLRLEPLETRALLSVSEICSPTSALVAEYDPTNSPEAMPIPLDALNAYESNGVASANVLVISGAVLDDADPQGAADALRATSIVVTSELDVVDAFDEEISLREALAYAESGATITFDDSLQGKTIALDSTLGQLEVSKSVTIDASNLWDEANSAPGLTISGEGATRILYVDGELDVQINGITLTNGYASGDGDNQNGGAIYSRYATLSLENCAIRDNTAYWGGGAYSWEGATSFVNCVVSNNASNSMGGGIRSDYGETTLVGCLLTNNTSSNGAAIDVYSGTLSLDSCVISDNNAYSEGGAIRANGETTLVNCALTNNSADGYGGGAALWGGAATLVNCTITNNTAGEGGGGDLSYETVLNAYNSIIVGNSASSGPDVNVYAESPDSSPVANAYNTLSTYEDWTNGANNLTYDASLPLFTDAAAGDYTLAIGSQAINKGDNQYVDVTTDVDLAGNPRISGGTVDLGAYEYQKIALAAPTPSMTDKTTSSITVTWDAVPNATGYRFIWKNRLDPAFAVYMVDAETTSYEFTDLEEGMYYLKIQALGDKIGYADSEYTALQKYQTQITLPAPDTFVKAKTETSIAAAWKAVPHAIGYAFQWKNETDSDFNVIQLGASTTSYKFSGLDNAATYEWKVRALGDAVDYLDSPDTELQIDQPRQKLETPVPYAKAKTETSITIAWDTNPNATGYRFIWKNRTAAAFEVFTVDAETTSYEFTNLDSDGIYYWKVQTLGDQIDYANSEYTALEIDKPQKALATPVATAASASTAYATVKWTYVPNAVGYGVSYKPVSASEWSAEINAGTNLRYVIEGFESGVEYNVRVRALGDKIDYANSDYSEVVVFKKLETPTPSATKTESTITVAWDTVLGATGYRFIWKNRLDPAYEVHTVDASTTSCEFTSLENNGIYYWKVQALGDNVSILNSEYCALQTVKLIKAPDPEVTFSIEAGSNVENQTLEIYAPKGCVVYYTTDGSDPVVSPENLYSEPIALSANASRFAADSNLINVGNAKIYDNNSLPKAVTVKAVAVAPNGAASPIETKTYFFQERESVAVISISTDYDNLLDYDTGIMVKGAYYDDWANTSEGAYIIAHKQWWNCQGNYTQKGKDWERPATVEIFDGENYVVENCGIRLRGGTSRMYSQKPFNIYFRKDYGAKTLDYALFEDAVSIDGNVLSAYKDFMLRNGGNDTEYLKFHDALIQSLVKDLNFTTQASRPAILYLNGEYMGVYVMQEKYSDRFFADHYLVDKDNVVVIEEGAVDEGKDADIALYEELQSYANMDMTDPEVYNAFRNVADVESMIDYYATEIYIANFDWHPTKNTRLWRVKTPENDSFGDGRWRWILYDTEYSSSLYKRTETAYNYDSFTAALEADSLFASVIRNADFYQAFAEKIESLAVNNFSSANVNSALASFSDAYRPYMSDYYKRFGDTSSAWNSNINGIRNFFANRARYILSFVENYQP